MLSMASAQLAGADFLVGIGPLGRGSDAARQLSEAGPMMRACRERACRSAPAGGWHPAKDMEHSEVAVIDYSPGRWPADAGVVCIARRARRSAGGAEWSLRADCGHAKGTARPQEPCRGRARRTVARTRRELFHIPAREVTAPTGHRPCDHRPRTGC